MDASFTMDDEGSNAVVDLLCHEVCYLIGVVPGEQDFARSLFGIMVELHPQDAASIRMFGDHRFGLFWACDADHCVGFVDGESRRQLDWQDQKAYRGAAVDLVQGVSVCRLARLGDYGLSCIEFHVCSVSVPGWEGGLRSKVL